MAKILIADDEKDIRDLVGFTLQIAGHSITAVSNGLEAIKQAQADRPDLILLDFRMPVMGGDVAAEKIRTIPELAGVPIIFLTAREQDPILAGQIANGARFIAKPFSIDQLTHTVSEVLAGN